MQKLDCADTPQLWVQGDVDSVPSLPLEHYRLFFIEHGEGPASIDNWQLHLLPGDVVAASPTEQFHCGANILCRAVSFHDTFFSIRRRRSEVYCDGVVFNRTSAKPRLALPEVEWPLIRHHFEELAQLVNAVSAFVERRIIGALCSILLQVSQYKLHRLSRAGGHLAQPLSPLVIEFQELLEHFYRRQRDVDFYCDELGVALPTLNRRLVSELGQSAQRAIDERVLIQARFELRSGKKTIERVACELGFDDAQYLSRLFQDQFGHSPSQFF